MKEGASSQLGTPRWIEAFVLLTFVALSYFIHGWNGLPPETAPGGFRMPILLLGLLVWATMEGDRVLRLPREERGNGAGQIVFLCGLGLTTSWNDLLFPLGVLVAVASGTVDPLYRRFVVRRRAGASTANEP